MNLLVLGTISFILLHIFFVLIIYLSKKYKESIPLYAKGLLLVFVLADWLLDATYLTIIMLEAPHYYNELVTDRFKRYNRQLRGKQNWLNKWRYMFMRFNCKILHKSDPLHCNKLE